MFSGDQSFSRDRQLDLMGDEWGHIRYPFGGGLILTRLNPGLSQTVPVFPVFLVYTGFFSFLDEFG